LARSKKLFWEGVTIFVNTLIRGEKPIFHTIRGSVAVEFLVIEVLFRYFKNVLFRYLCVDKNLIAKPFLLK
jgi:hypothetical protein